MQDWDHARPYPSGRSYRCSEPVRHIDVQAVGQLSALGIGQSTCVGIGEVHQWDDIDTLSAFNDDPDTDAVV